MIIEPVLEGDPTQIETHEEDFLGRRYAPSCGACGYRGCIQRSRSVAIAMARQHAHGQRHRLLALGAGRRSS